MLKESFIWDNDNKVAIEVIKTFSLLLKIYYLDLVETYVALSII